MCIINKDTHIKEYVLSISISFFFILLVRQIINTMMTTVVDHREPLQTQVNVCPPNISKINQRTTQLKILPFKLSSTASKILSRSMV